MVSRAWWRADGTRRRAATRRRRCLALAALGFVSAACFHTPPQSDRWLSDVQAIDESEIRQRVILVGDAGDLDGGRELLALLGRFVRSHVPDRTVVVYLGDNLYDSADIIAADARACSALDAQLEAGNGAQALLFVPGNHDWESAACWAGFSDGVAKLTNEARYLKGSARGAGRARFVLPPGCPGPEVVDLDGLRLIALDSEWWLQDVGERTRWAAASGCQNAEEEPVLHALRAALACEPSAACPPRLISAHHPLITMGKHGGWFSWREHLLCIDYLPLPLLCSLYVVARQLGVSRQDLASPPYRHFVDRVSRALATDPPLAWAAGHDHNLQVLAGSATRFVLVSGAGSRLSAVRHDERTLFAQTALGFMVVDALHDGRVELRVFSLGGSRPAHEPVYTVTLQPARANSRPVAR